MPSVDEFYADIEADRASRESEIRYIEGILSQTESEDGQKILRRSLILLTYSHVEGFAKYILISYAETISGMGLPCSKAYPPVRAMSLSKVFAALRDPKSKHDAFRKALPDDAKLHLAARERIFIEDYEQITAQPIMIPESAIDTKSNLDGDQLKKLMFQLGLNYEAVSPYHGTLGKLVGVRNAIAHGDRLMDPKKDVRTYVTAAFTIMQFLQNEVREALRNEAYLIESARTTCELPSANAVAAG